MKRRRLVTALLCTLLCVLMSAAAAGQEQSFYTIDYISNLEGSTSSFTQQKEPGADAVIENTRNGKIGWIFAGWATSPDAAQADYLPGDKYSADENLTLYGVWKAPYELGTLEPEGTFDIAPFPVKGTKVYLRFTAAQTGAYRLRSTGGSLANATTFGSVEILKMGSYSWDTVARGSYIQDPQTYMAQDFTVTARLTAGETYLLSYYCAPDALHLQADTSFYTIDYISNLEGSTSSFTQEKEPGVDAVIENTRNGKIGWIFAGWATSPDAAQADYLPGDKYSADENLTLYGVWKAPYELGTLEPEGTFDIAPFPVKGTAVYLRFTAAQTGAYRLRSTGGSLANATTFGSVEILKMGSYSWDTVARGSYIWDSQTYMAQDFTVTARLTAGETYLLSYYCAPDVLHLQVDNGFSTIDYISNLEGSTNSFSQEKEPGVDAVIENTRNGKIGWIFAGWATSPDAAQAEYLPGDAYAADEDLTLYGVWRAPYELGMLGQSRTLVIAPFPVKGTEVYLRFTAAQTGAYRLRSTGGSLANATTFGSVEILKMGSYSWDTVARGSYIRDSQTYMVQDFTVTARLTAGETYLLSYCCAPDALHLSCEMQSELNVDLWLPASLRRVEREAFAGGVFESVYIPVSVEFIGENAFDRCASLRTVYLESADVQIDDNAFGDCSTLTIAAPEGSTGEAFAAEHGFDFEPYP